MARLAFFGTPEFSLPSLQAIYRFCEDFGHELAVVVSQEDRPSGRGQQVIAPPVKRLANDLGIPVMQPKTIKKGTQDGDNFFSHMKSLSLDLVVVVAYGKIITDRLLALPTHGFVNVHASLLPRFRGAAPIQRAIEAGDRVTGVCLMDMVKQLDAGDVFAVEETPILPFDTAETLFHRLSHLGGGVLYKHLGSLLSRSMARHPQSNDGITYAHMLTKEEGALNFHEHAKLLSNRVKAFDPWPGTYSHLRGKRIKFFHSFFIEDKNFKMANVDPGTVVVADSFLGIRALDGIVYFQMMQVEGKKMMSIKEALKGFSITVGDKLDF